MLCWAATRGITDSYTGGSEGENSSADAGECGEGNEARVCLGATLRVAHFSDGGGYARCLSPLPRLAARRCAEIGCWAGGSGERARAGSSARDRTGGGGAARATARHALMRRRQGMPCHGAVAACIRTPVVPPGTCIPENSPPASPPVPSLASRVDARAPPVPLCAQLLVCYVLLQASQGARSPWHAYLRCLPRCYSLLSRFTPHHMAMLQVGITSSHPKPQTLNHGPPCHALAHVPTSTCTAHTPMFAQSYPRTHTTHAIRQSSVFPFDPVTTSLLGPHPSLPPALLSLSSSASPSSRLSPPLLATPFPSHPLPSHPLSFPPPSFPPPLLHPPPFPVPPTPRALLRAMAVPGKWLSWPAWSWGHCTVSSRTLYVPWDEAGALCPVADLLNYEPLSPTAPAGAAAAAASPPAPPALPPSPSPLPAQPCCSHMPGDVDGSTAHTDDSTAHTDSSTAHTDASTAHTDASTAHTDDSTAHTDDSTAHIDASTVGEAVSAGACDPECMRDAAALSDCTPDMHRVALSGKHATTAPPTCARITATHHAAMHATPHAAALASDAGTDSCDLVTQAYNGVTHACDRAADACDRVTDGGYSEEAQAYHIFARRRFEAGEQVVICYGCYSNLHLLLHYGFLLPANPHDCIPMHPPCDPHQLGIPLPPPPPPCSSAAHTTPPPLCLQADGTPSFLLLALLRVWTTPYRLRRRVRHVALSGSAVSEEGEVAVQRWVGGECERLLAALPSTVQQDEALLSCLRAGGGSKGEGAQRTMEGAGVGGKGCARGAGSGTEGVGTEDKEGGCDAHGEGVRTAAEEEQQKAVLAVMWRVGYKRLLQRGMAVAQRALHAASQC
ncbi:unnamed protein product [Closterium sp. Naga37s-1]|nr:unnamed protein product [Closterium sp. Naga37s-1]